MSQSVDKRTLHRTLVSLLDHIIREAEQRGGNVDAKGLGCLEIDYKLKSGRLLHRQTRRVRALENTVDINRSPPEQVIKVWSVRHEGTFFREAS